MLFNAIQAVFERAKQYKIISFEETSLYFLMIKNLSVICFLRLRL